MGRLLLMRHGESEGNRDRVFTKTPDVPLTATGAVQVRAAAEWIRVRYAPARIIASPYHRARQSAAIAAEVLAVGVEVEDDLRERSYGELAGRPYTEALRHPGYDPACWWRWCPPGGEPIDVVAARAGAVVDRLIRTAPADDLLIVSHGAVMRALWWHVTGSWGEARVARNAGLVLVEHRDGAYGTIRALDEAGNAPVLERTADPVE